MSLTVISYQEWLNNNEEELEPVERDCPDCEGLGDCEGCGRECMRCDGEGTVEEEPSRANLRQLHFDDVMRNVSRLCAWSSKHDFLEAAGEVVKILGRP